MSAWNCIRRLLTLAPPSTFSSVSSTPASRCIASSRSRDLIGHRLDGRPGDVGRGRAARDADDRAAGVGIPIRRAEPDERRHQVHAVRIGHAGGQALDVGRLFDDAQPVAQPLHDRAGDEHRAFQAVGDLAAESPADRGQQLVLRGDRLVPRVEQQEAAGAVGVLGAADVEAGLAERGRLLVAGTAGDGQSARRSIRRSFRRSTSLDGSTSGSMARGNVRGSSAARRPSRACGC